MEKRGANVEKNDNMKKYRKNIYREQKGGEKYVKSRI